MSRRGRRLPIQLVLGLLWTASLTLCFNLEPRTAQLYPYPLASTQGRESYFGFSVALQHIERDNANWAIVGAPRANLSYHDGHGITEPGGVFRCSLTSDTCEDMRVDTEDNKKEGAEQFRYRIMKDHGWLGESLDTQPNYQSNRQTTCVCAPNWMAFKSNIEHMNGACYLAFNSISNNNTFTKKAILMYKEQKYGQMGFSVHFPDDPTKLVLGAPGVDGWKGSVLLLKDETNEGGNERKKRDVSEDSMFHAPDPPTSDSIEEDDLLGYSVTSGKFLKHNETHYAAGAPRGAYSFGKVLIFEFPSKTEKKLLTRKEFEGEQIGEYFGAALTAADINGDGLDDLIVGSPMYSHNGIPDVGRVHTFISKEGNESNVRPKPHYGKYVPSGRFGTSLASPGDLNADGYEDIAVGAPWEDNGAVYIFLGSPSGLKHLHSQRLSPEDFPSGLRGFGMSISRGIDIDKNEYPDLAIGSFLSGHLIVIKSRPVVILSGKVISNPAIVPWEEEATVSLETCLRYTGYRIPKNLPVHAKLILDQGSTPVRALFPDKSNTHSFVENLAIDKDTCRTHVVNVEKDKIHPDNSIIMKLEYEVANTSNLELIKMPMTDPAADNYTLGYVDIAKECNDAECKVDMRTQAKFIDGNNNTVVIGKVNKLRVEVSNSGEPVYLPNMTVTADPQLTLTLPASYNCMFLTDDRSALKCNLSNTIKKSSSPDILEVGVEVNESRLMENTSHVKLKVDVSGEGLELGPDDNILEMPLKLATQANLKLFLYSKEEQVHYELTEDKKSILTKKVKFYHTYNLIKEGPTPLELVDLSINIPVNFTGGMEFVKVYDLKKKFPHPFKCYLNGTTLANESSRSVPVSSKNSSDNISSEIQFESALKEATISPQYFNCSSSLIQCAQLYCSFHNWTVDSQSAEVSVELEVDLAILAKYISVKDVAVFGSMATAAIQSLNPQRTFIGKNSTRGEVVTYIKPAILPGADIPWWVIVLAVLGSLLLLGLVSYGLYKKGFFKREEMEEVRAHRAHLERSPPGGEANVSLIE